MSSRNTSATRPASSCQFAAGVISQQLIPTADGKGSVLAAEYLGPAAVRTMIREGKEHQLYTVMQTSQAAGMYHGLALAQLCFTGKITREEALERCVDRIELERLLQKQSFASAPKL